MVIILLAETTAPFANLDSGAFLVGDVFGATLFEGDVSGGTCATRFPVPLAGAGAGAGGGVRTGAVAMAVAVVTVVAVFVAVAVVVPVALF